MIFVFILVIYLNYFNSSCWVFIKFVHFRLDINTWRRVAINTCYFLIHLFLLFIYSCLYTNYKLEKYLPWFYLKFPSPRYLRIGIGFSFLSLTKFFSSKEHQDEVFFMIVGFKYMNRITHIFYIFIGLY